MMNFEVKEDEKTMRNFYVSYQWSAKNWNWKMGGFGRSSFTSEGIFSEDDIADLSIKLASKVKESLGLKEDVKVIVINWREFDKPL